ncbi:metallophosphoesterase [Butyrivibrio proteoclasticus]|uniref:metallophosphoesterase n=1 Tax=Butyrivibrio proteoclasticus TaxID=43305 RepID=UPI00047939AE|nr:metallophosphoesterase [Butyrivibrio proteoclasticus]
MWIYIIIAIIILAVISGFVIYHDTHSFVVREYEVKTNKIKGNYTFVLLSDLHGYVFGDDNDKLIDRIDEIRPDAILCAGDMLTGQMKEGKVNYKPGLDLLTNLASKYPVYYGNGNHETKTKEFTKEFGNFFDRYKSMLLRGRVNVLENYSILLGNENIRITGLDLELDYFRKVIKKKMDSEYLEKHIGKADPNMFQVLIAHNPQYFKEYSKWGADLTVSGHVHGGIVRLPLIGGVISPALALFPRYDGGKYVRNGRTMILSRGLGTHTIHVRMFNPGEIDVIRVCEG